MWVAQAWRRRWQPPGFSTPAATAAFFTRELRYSRRQDLDKSQETSFPDDFDQRPPPQWEEDQWDQRPIGDPTVPQTLAGPDIAPPGTGKSEKG